MKLFNYLLSFLWPVRIENRSSKISTALEVNLYRGRYLLDSARANYSFGGLHMVLRKAFDHFKVRNRKPASLLVLGFGAGSVASILYDEYNLQPLITGVEVDPEVISLTRTYFDPARYSKLRLVEGDAFEFIRADKAQYDMIVVDVFVELDVPPLFFSQEFIASAAGRLALGGQIFFNLVIHHEKVRDKGAQLFKDLNRMAGPTEWFRLRENRTENWVFVTTVTAQ